MMGSRVARRHGRLDEAATLARDAARFCERLSPGYAAEALAGLARIERDRGDVAASVLAARRALERLDALGTWCNDTHVRAGCAEVLYAAGEDNLARRTLAAAVAQVEARAARIDNPAYRASFLERVPMNVALLDLARRRLAGREEAPSGIP